MHLSGCDGLDIMNLEPAGSLPGRSRKDSSAPAEDDAASGELTDKGYINQRLTLQRRAADVDALYALPADPRVVRL
jgi:feruloyl-CoA synthase